MSRPVPGMQRGIREGAAGAPTVGPLPGLGVDQDELRWVEVTTAVLAPAKKFVNSLMSSYVSHQVEVGVANTF